MGKEEGNSEVVGTELALSLNDVFDLYVEVRDNNPLDPPSTVASRVSARSNIDSELILDWISDRGWDVEYKRILEHRSQVAAAITEASHADRYLNISETLRQKALAALLMIGEDAGLQFDSVDEVRRALETAMKMERDTLGMADARVAVDVTVDLDKEIRRLQDILVESGEEDIVEGVFSEPEGEENPIKSLEMDDTQGNDT